MKNVDKVWAELRCGSLDRIRGSARWSLREAVREDVARHPAPFRPVADAVSQFVMDPGRTITRR